MTGCAKASAVAKAEEPVFSPDPIELEDPDPDLKTLLTNQNNKIMEKRNNLLKNGFMYKKGGAL
jgi:hypothetical protein